jgi:tRNA(Ile)-lysidine synthase
LIEGDSQFQRLDLPDRIQIRRSGDRLQIIRADRPLRGIQVESGVAKRTSYHYDVPSPEMSPVTVEIQESNLRIRFSRIRAEDLSNLTGQRVAFFDMNKLSFPLHLRRFQPGDRFIPLGMKGHQKLKKYFVDHKVPTDQRRTCPVLVNQGQIIWLVGHRIDERYKVEPSTRWVLACALSCLAAQDD